MTVPELFDVLLVVVFDSNIGSTTSRFNSNGSDVLDIRKYGKSVKIA